MPRPDPPKPAPRPGRKRRWAIGLALTGAASVVALPAWVALPFVQAAIKARINAAFAPGRLDVGRIRVSWTGPTELESITLTAPDGSTPLVAPAATLDRTLAQLVTGRISPATLTVHRPSVVIDRGADGKVGLSEALQAVVKVPNPGRALTLVIPEGKVRVVDPMIPGGLDLGIEGFALDKAVAPHPAEFRVGLTTGRGAVEVEGMVDRWTAPGGDPDRSDLDLKLRSRGFEVAYRSPQASVAGVLQCSATLSRKSDRWTTRGDLRWVGGSATMKALGSDPIDLGDVGATWEATGGTEGWAIRLARVDSKLVQMGGSGQLGGPSSDEPIRVGGKVDLAEAARLLRTPLGLDAERQVESGMLNFDIASIGPGFEKIRFTLNLDGLVAKGGQRRFSLGAVGGQYPLSLIGTVDTTSNVVEVSEATISTVYGSASGSGRVADFRRSPQADFRGEARPDFARINEWLGQNVEPGASVAGQPLTFRLAGPLRAEDGSASNLPPIDAELTTRLDSADVCGMKLGVTPIGVRVQGGRIVIDPIVSTLNGGSVAIAPTIDLDDPMGPKLRLAEGSRIDGAEINDEVSMRVLAFVAPILNGATRASGRVSVDLARAEIPLTKERRAEAVVEGHVVFRDVAFAPGPLADQILGVIGRPEGRLRLDAPVTLAIADGRVTQSGLALPVGNLTRVEVAGWVDFDRNLSLTASLPVTPSMLGNNPLLSDIAAGTSVDLPIGGTLDRPRVDRDAFAANLKASGKSLLSRTAARGAFELLSRIGQPRPGTSGEAAKAPAPTAAERKAARQERRAERKAARNGEGPGGP